MKPALDPSTDPRTAAIDAALRRVGAQDPTPGLEGRILTRLAAARLNSEAPNRRAPWLRFTYPAMGALTAALIAAAIVGGSVRHSHEVPPGPVVAPPVLPLPAQGLGTASAVHAAAPTSTPVPATQASRGRSARRIGPGRARIAPHTHRAPGVAVPGPAAASPN